MSTRSGKRIHTSIHENNLKPDEEQVLDSTRKTRSKRLKENVEDFSVSLLKNVKRTNYVSYPTDEEVGSDTVNGKEIALKPTRLLRKNALKEINLITPSTTNDELQAEIKKPSRTTRSTRKFAEDAIEDVQESQNHVDEVYKEETRKSKKGKKKIQPEKEQIMEETVTTITVTKKKLKKKKGKGRRSGSMIIEDVEPEKAQKMSLNRSNISTDSFHSAAGSPNGEKNQIEDNVPLDIVIPKHEDSEVMNTSFETNAVVENQAESNRRRTRSFSRLGNVSNTPDTPKQIVKVSQKRKSSVKDLDSTIGDGTLDIGPQEPINGILSQSKKRKLCIQDAASNINTSCDEEVKNLTFELEGEKMDSIKISTSKGNLSKKRKSSVVNVVSEDVNVNATFDKEIKNSTFDIDKDCLEKNRSTRNSIFDVFENTTTINTTYDKNNEVEARKSIIKDSPFDKNSTVNEKNITYEKETPTKELADKSQTCKSIIDTTFEKTSNNCHIDLIPEIDSKRKSAIENITFEKAIETKLEQDRSSIKNATFDKDPSINSGTNDTSNLINPIPSLISSSELNNTYDKSDSTFDKDKKLDLTFEKISKSSLISSDNSSNLTSDKCDTSRISITSDDSRENNIVNMTPVLIDSSLDESQIVSKPSPKSSQRPPTPLKREGTFTKDVPEVVSPKLNRTKTPTKRMSLPSPGCTPFHENKSTTKEKSVLNVTRSVEKSRRSSLAEPLPRTTKVMFCSPVNNPAVVLQQGKKIIKSNLKGSNKSFVFEESVTSSPCPRPAARKRSYTQSDAEDARAKRKRLAGGPHHAAARPLRPRTSSASGKLAEPSTPSKKPLTPKKSEVKIPRTKLPNFAALHQKQFDKMESLGECQQRKAKRAKQLLTPTGSITVLERSISPKDNTAEPEKPSTTEPQKQKNEKESSNDKSKESASKADTPVKSLPTLKSLNPGYSRFGFKLNLDVNPFSIPKTNNTKNDSIFNFSSKKDSKAKTSLFSFSSKKDNTKSLKDIKNLKREATLPSFSGTSVRKEVAKQTVMREKSFTDRRNVNRNETRTVIKGVRTNRRFELQMRMRNLD